MTSRKIEIIYLLTRYELLLGIKFKLVIYELNSSINFSLQENNITLFKDNICCEITSILVIYCYIIINVIKYFYSFNLIILF